MSSRVIYPSPTAGTTLLAYPSQYINRDYVKVYTRPSADASSQVVFPTDTPLDPGVDYTWLSSGQIQLATPADGDTDYMVQRETPFPALVTQQPGVLSSAKVNLIATQYGHVTEELGDQVADLAATSDSALGRSLRLPVGEAFILMPSKAELAGGLLGFTLAGEPYKADAGTGDSGLRVDLATGPGLEIVKGEGAYPSAREELDDKGPRQTKSIAVGASLYPVEYRLGRDHPPHPFEFIPANQHASILNGTTSYDASDNLQAMLNGWEPNLNAAGIVDFPSGVYGLAKPLVWKNWIAWRGGGRGTTLRALNGHAGPHMFHFSSDPTKVLPTPSAQFNQRLEGFDIDVSQHVAGRAAITSVIYAPSWNEKCGLRDVLARNVGCTFLLIDEWHGGSSGFGIEDLEVMFTAATYAAGVTGIHLKGRNRADTTDIINRPQITMRNCSIVGGTAGVDDANPGLTLIHAENVHLQLLGGIHFEKAKAGIYVSRGAQLTGFGVTGSTAANRVVHLIERAGNHTGTIRLQDIYKGDGGVRILKDNKAATNLTNAIQDGLSVPSQPGEAWAQAYITFSGTTPTIVSSQGPIASVAYASAAGYHTVTFSDAFNAATDYEVLVDVFDTTDCRGRVRPGEKAAGNFNFRMQRESDDSGYNAAAALVRIFRKPGL